ncbi:hypothetical protein M501DRAFT_936697 [Patellaria atrata CBS 101060]|uniref:Uncharacterized protein n=1 Tax=Patellaria atrata CBS 101060 TaxID=1346257 RepID=A0A9P4S855_9PEZI|nr:hypothetical protein M501DRAFT_936697 [Patellaria atrata CBS 101060]
MDPHDRRDHIMNATQQNRPMQNQPTTMDDSLNMGDEVVGDSDEPPDEQLNTPKSSTDFRRSLPSAAMRKQSLLTQGLTARSESHDDSKQRAQLASSRSASTWSNTSTASTAELTSDGGLTSPGTRANTPSPPLPSNQFHGFSPMFKKEPFAQATQIRRDDHDNVDPLQKSPSLAQTQLAVEAAVEAKIGHKRCIRFACGGNTAAKPNAPKVELPKPKPAVTSNEELSAQLKRRCMLKFACPTKVSDNKSESENKRRLASPPPPTRRNQTSATAAPRHHRDSDATVRNESPKAARKPFAPRTRKWSQNSDVGRTEATRFHEFANSDEEVDEWTQQSTCHRKRLTVNDTLVVENGLRKLGQEVEEEALEDEEAALDEDIDQDNDGENENGDNEDDNFDEEKLEIDEEESTESFDDVSDVSDVSDAGFDTDDEEGFARSDDESDAGSEDRWWAPGYSTAATSTDLGDFIRPNTQRTMSNSSSSVHSDDGSLKTHGALKKRMRRRARPLNIRPRSPELPDSTDFVCGTLDEDRPLEDAYMSNIERKRAAKHIPTPQDIDPTFPQSDPDLCEEDEEDDDNEENHVSADESDQHLFMHGQPDAHEEPYHRGRRGIVSRKKSPLPSPKRLVSPPPRARLTTHRSPPPRRLFGQSPRRMRSPPVARLRSPPPRRTSFGLSPRLTVVDDHHREVLAERPQLAYATSLPRASMMSRVTKAEDSDNEDTPRDVHSRGAIDIVKGLEKKRQLRKEKLYQKYCRKAAEKKDRRPAPGKGAERMRELGLELNAYRGKRTITNQAQEAHILSI